MIAGGVTWAELIRLIDAHFLLALCAVLAATVLGLPIGVWAARERQARTWLLGTVSLAQTIPGLALLALFYPTLLLLARATGWAIPALGFLPALLALTIYALLPIMRNTVAALQGLDPALIEAANGLGMTNRQRLTIVVLPLAAPVIVSGIRTSAVWTIGTATLATTIGQPSLGDLIFSGLQTENWQRVLVGCIAAAALALIVDACLAAVETGLLTRSRRRWRIGLALLAAVSLAILVAGAAGRERAAPSDRATVVIGAKNFSEQFILARLIARRLQRAGMRTELREGLGSAVAYRALAAGDIDIYVDYSGTLWTNVLGRTDNPPRDVMLPTLGRELGRRDGVRLLCPLGFDNAYAFAMQRGRAERLGIASLADLAAKARGLTLGSDLEFLSRPEWDAVAATYDMKFGATRSYSPTFMYRALESGTADVISAFFSDGRIAALDLVTLSDPRRALPGYDAVMLLSAKAAKDRRIVQTLEGLDGAIPIAAMRRANWMVDRESDKRSPLEAAKWLEAELAGTPAQ